MPDVRECSSTLCTIWRSSKSFIRSKEVAVVEEMEVVDNVDVDVFSVYVVL